MPPSPRALYALAAEKRRAVGVVALKGAGGEGRSRRLALEEGG